MKRSTIIALLLIALLGGCEQADVPVAVVPRRGGLDVTFIVTADTHIGAKVIVPDPLAASGQRKVSAEELNRQAIEHMNAMPGKPWPAEIGGVVDQPLAVLIAGDITESGAIGQWTRFRKLYGRTGREGLLKFPVYECIGNHDLGWGLYTSLCISAIHGACHYSWDWADLHMVCLGEGANGISLPWLRRDLAAVGRDRPIIIFQHYPLAGPWSTGTWYGDGNYRQRFAEAIDGFNVVGIFHGHFHASGTYNWRGRNVYNVGSAKHAWRDFAVVRVTDQRITVAAWNWELGRWWWWRSTPINGHRDERGDLTVNAVPPGPGPRPLVPHPTDDPRAKPR